ncbi:hypothetical protein [Salmonella phage Tennessee]
MSLWSLSYDKYFTLYHIENQGGITILGSIHLPATLKHPVIFL